MKNESNYDVLSKHELMRILVNEIKVVQEKQELGQKKIYFAAPWFSEKAKLFYKTCEKIYEKCKNSKYKLYFPKNNSFESTKETFTEDVKQIELCDAMIAWVDEKDIGTAWEIGMAFSLGKPIYLLGLDESSFKKKTNLMLAYTGKCFTLNKFDKFLTVGLGHDDFVDVEKCWEAIE